MTSNADLQAQIDAEARSIAAFNNHEQTWQDCSQKPVHHRGRYCEHQVAELANHLVRNRIQREDAQKQVLLKAGDAMYRALANALQADPDSDEDITNLIGGGTHTLRDWKAALKGLA